MQSFELIKKLARTSLTQTTQKRQVIWNAKKTPIGLDFTARMLFCTYHRRKLL